MAETPPGGSPERPLQYHPTATGTFYLPGDAPRDVIIKAITAGVVFDAPIVEAARRFIRPGTTVLDVGARFGQMSILFSTWAGEAGEVIAFEAGEFVHGVLKKNIEAKGKKNIRTVCRAVYDRAGERKFYPVPDFERFGS